MMMPYANEYLSDIVIQGGPQPHEYEQFLNSLKSTQGLSIKTSDGTWQWLKRAMGDALSFKTVQGLAYQKVHGAHNGYELRERTYGRYVAQESRLQNWDRLWHETDYAHALNDQKVYFQHWVRKIESETDDCQVLDIGSGSGRGIYESLVDSSDRTIFTGIDADQEAVDYAKLLCRNFTHRTRFARQGIRTIAPEPQWNLIWAANIFDFVTDFEFKSNVRTLLHALKPGGTVIISNVCCTFSHCHYLEFLDWKLNYRSDAHLKYLIGSLGIRQDHIEVFGDRYGVCNYVKVTLPENTSDYFIM